MGATEHTIFLTVSFIVAIITFVMGIMAMGLKAKASTLFSLLMISIALWCFGIGGQMMSTTEAMSLHWIYGQMLGVVLVAPLWLLFTVYYSDNSDRIRPWMYPILFVNSVVVMVCLVVPSLRHHLVTELVYQEVLGYLVNVEWKIGPYFWVHLTITFIMVMLGDFFILRHALQWPKSERKKLIMVIIATFFPLFTNLSLVLNLFPQIHGNIDVFGFAAAGIVLGWVLYKDKLLELQPIAARYLMEELPDALLVFNANRDVIERNPSAYRLFGDQIAPAIYDQFRLLLNAPQLAASQSVRTKFVLPQDTGDLHFDIQITPLIAAGRLAGYSMMLRDVTELINSIDKLELLATTDPLTDLYNRRYFQTAGERILEQSIRYQHPICVMTFDIDHFKNINDQYGHHAGDEVLKQVAALIRATTRGVDIVARFGGDEFVILLPESTSDYAVSLAERLQLRLKTEPCIVGAHQLHITFSFGIASSHPGINHGSLSLDELMREADLKLYEAKQQGRDRIRSISF